MNRLPQPTGLVRCGSIVIVWVLLFFGAVASGQESTELPKLNIIDQLGVPGLGGPSAGEKATFSAEYRIAEGTRRGRLSVTAVMQPSWHVYSVTQPPGATQPTVITLAAPDQASITGEFRPNVAPHVKQYPFYDVPVEEHEGTVVWTAPIELAEGIDPTSTDLQVKFDGLSCQDKGSCIPIENKAIVAKFAGYYKDEPTVTPTVTEFRTGAGHLTLRGTIHPSTVRAGDTVTLTLTAEPEPTWHIYAYSELDSKLPAKPTLIVICEPASWPSTAVTASAKPIKHETGLDEMPVVYFHDGPVSWSVEIAIPADTAPGPYDIAGLIGFQTCTLSQCDLPAAAEFRGAVEVGPVAASGESPLGFAAARYKEVADLTSKPKPEVAAPAGSVTKLDLDNLETQGSSSELSTPVVLLMAFAAGFILNFMPCVLPVIGLKVMAFVQQAGDSRARSLMLNVWYSLGLMSVFLILATLSVFMGLGWGEQFSSVTFNVILTSVVFAFALSFLGVWEIPIPGFVGSGKVGDLATKEGASGAFFKGVLTTVLATPCSGPLLGSALTWAVSQPPAIAYAGFTCVGLGMASPYLLIGAFPQLVSFLPRPGAWMDTFKHIMGFVLLGTVIFLLTFIPIPFVVPTVAFMMALWAAFWWVGRVPMTQSLDKKAAAWVGATAFAALIGVIAFGAPFEPVRSKNLQAIMSTRFQRAVDQELAARNDSIEPRSDSSVGGHELAWRPYTQELLEQLVSERKTVFVDFTADW